MCLEIALEPASPREARRPLQLRPAMIICIISSVHLSRLELIAARVYFFWPMGGPLPTCRGRCIHAEGLTHTRRLAGAVYAFRMV